MSFFSFLRCRSVVFLAALILTLSPALAFAHETGEAHEEPSRSEKSGAAKAVGSAIILIAVGGIAWKFFFKKEKTPPPASSAGSSPPPAAPVA